MTDKVKDFRADPRYARKSLNKINNNFSGDDLEEICKENELWCPLCGARLIPYRDYGQFAYVTCTTTNCVNNIDSPLRFDMKTIHRSPFWNKDHLKTWMPKRLV